MESEGETDIGNAPDEAGGAAFTEISVDLTKVASAATFLAANLETVPLADAAVAVGGMLATLRGAAVHLLAGHGDDLLREISEEQDPDRRDLMLQLLLSVLPALRDHPSNGASGAPPSATPNDRTR